MKSFLLALLFVGLVTAEFDNINFIQRSKRVSGVLRRNEGH
jgi:hypothetical protein